MWIKQTPEPFWDFPGSQEGNDYISASQLTAGILEFSDSIIKEGEKWPQNEDQAWDSVPFRILDVREETERMMSPLVNEIELHKITNPIYQHL